MNYAHITLITSRDHARSKHAMCALQFIFQATIMLNIWSLGSALSPYTLGGDDGGVSVSVFYGQLIFLPTYQ